LDYPTSPEELIRIWIFGWAFWDKFFKKGRKVYIQESIVTDNLRLHNPNRQLSPQGGLYRNTKKIIPGVQTPFYIEINTPL
jgi:hypothetical protein